MKLISLSTILCAGLLASVASANGWEDDQWADDNAQNRQDQNKTPIDTLGAQGSQASDSFTVDYFGNSPVSYDRLCDFVAKVKLTDDSTITQTEKAFVSKKVLRRNRDVDISVKYFVSDNPGFRFIRDSQIVDMSCLRWKGSDTPNPAQNPAQRPGQLPHQVCNPDQHPQGCANTCQASQGNQQQCDNPSTDWPSRDNYWN